jgi:uncharacterized membrane protein YfcA
MLIEILTLVGAGALVGYAVGLTGVGGGSLMTPILLLLGYPAPVAIGTDLLYAGITKSGGMLFHHRRGNVAWRTTLLLAAGSIPMTLLLNLWLLDHDFRQQAGYEELLTTVLGIMLLVTATVVGFQRKIQHRLSGDLSSAHVILPSRGRDMITVSLGLLLGISVTLSSVGAGAFGAAVLFLLFPTLPTVKIVGTDIAHAVPLTLVGGLGYLYNGQVDFSLLAGLLCGSIPGIWLGSHTGALVPEKIMRSILVLALTGLGIKFAFF